MERSSGLPGPGPLKLDFAAFEAGQSIVRFLVRSSIPTSCRWRKYDVVHVSNKRQDSVENHLLQCCARESYAGALLAGVI
jgi:hypothetical protein